MSEDRVSERSYQGKNNIVFDGAVIKNLTVAGGDSPAPTREPNWKPTPGAPVQHAEEWILGSEIGSGGFGSVWLARHRDTAEQSVFKFAYDEDCAHALRTEARTVRLLRKAARGRMDILPVDQWHVRSHPYFIRTRYAELGTLEDWAQRQPGGLAGIPLRDRIELVARIAEALAAVHEFKVIHRDLKPTNVVMLPSPSGPYPALIDFGLAGILDPSMFTDQQVTIPSAGDAASSGSSPGGSTHRYRDPTVHSLRDADERYDLYSLGVMLFQMVLGDFEVSLTPGWDESLDDPLLREPITLATHFRRDRRLAGPAALAESLRRLEQVREQRAALSDQYDIAKQIAEEERRRAEAERVRAQAEHRAAEAAGARADAERRARVKAALWLVAVAIVAVVAVSGWVTALAANARFARSVGLRYQAGIRAASSDVRTGSLAQAQATLLHLAEGDTQKLTGWEWKYLDAASVPRAVVLPGISSAVMSGAFDSSGELVATGDESGDTRVWNSHTGAMLRRLRYPEEGARGIWCLGFSPKRGDDHLVTANEKGHEARVWRASTGEGVCALSHGSPVTCIAFNANGDIVATGSKDSTAKLWSATEWANTPIATLHHPTWVLSIAFNPAGTVVATGDFDGVVMLWDGHSGAPLRTLRTFEQGQAWALAFSPDGRRLVVGRGHGQVQVWDLKDWKAMQPGLEFKHDEGVVAVDVSHDGRYAVTAAHDGTCRVWDLASPTGTPARFLYTTHIHNTGPNWTAAFNPLADSIATTSFDGTAHVWNPFTEYDLALTTPASSSAPSPINSAAFSPDGNRLLTVSEDNSARIWDTRTSVDLATTGSRVLDWCFADDESSIAAIDKNGVFRRLSLDGRSSTPSELTLSQGSVRAAVLAPKGDTVLMQLGSSESRLVRTDTPADPVDLPASISAFTAAAFEPGNRPSIHLGYSDGTVLTFQLDTGSATAPSRVSDEPVASIACDAERRRLHCVTPSGIDTVTTLSGDSFGRLRLDLGPASNPPAQLKKIGISYGHLVGLTADSAMVWDTGTGAALHRFGPDPSNRTCIAVSRDGHRIATGCFDRKVRLYDAASGNELLVLQAGDDWITGVGFSPSGRYLAAVSYTGLIRVWDSARPTTATVVSAAGSALHRSPRPLHPSDNRPSYR